MKTVHFIPIHKQVMAIYASPFSSTNSPKYSWLNKCLAWGIGTVDMKQGKVFVEVFIP